MMVWCNVLFAPRVLVLQPSVSDSSYLSTRYSRVLQGILEEGGKGWQVSDSHSLCVAHARSPAKWLTYSLGEVLLFENFVHSTSKQYYDPIIARR
ncbi:hypothetical protein F5Y05DRAFT_262327 [Hypoxylon sp. FL0543]|nr:hypothetical protein F5Y05DRAFT_262327 [Hypoxylon sp. FL0543]